MLKSEVYSWRVDSEIKSALEEAARAERTSVARLLDRIVAGWLRQASVAGPEDELQQRLHASARSCFGTLERGDPDLAEQAKRRVRSKLRKRYRRQGAD